MKKSLIALAAATVLALGVTACDTSDTATDTPAAVDVAERGILPKATSTTAPADITLPQSERERIFREMVRDRGIPADVSIAYSLCDAFDAGVTGREALRLGIKNGIPAADVGYLIGASTGLFCPEHNDILGRQS